MTQDEGRIAVLMSRDVSGHAMLFKVLGLYDNAGLGNEADALARVLFAAYALLPWNRSGQNGTVLKDLLLDEVLAAEAELLGVKDKLTRK